MRIIGSITYSNVLLIAVEGKELYAVIWTKATSLQPPIFELTLYVVSVKMPSLLPPKVLLTPVPMVQYMLHLVDKARNLFQLRTERILILR